MPLLRCVIGRGSLGLLAALMTFIGKLPAASADTLALVAGGGAGPDGSLATQASLSTPFGVVRDKAGNLILVEMVGQRVRKVDSHGILTTIAGTGEKGDGGDGGPAIKAQFNGMHSLALAPNGDLYLADTFNNRVRKIAAGTGDITTVAGTGEKGFSGDGGPAIKAQFGAIYCVALDPRGEKLYLADLDNRRIRAMDLKTETVTTVAGNGEKGVPEDGQEALKSPLLDPRAVAADSNGNVYILERSGHVLRVVDAQGKIRTVVGTGKPGPAMDPAPAREATLNGPKHLCVDREGNVIIADTDNHVIRKYLPRAGRVVRVAGTGKKGQGEPGAAPEQTALNQPHGVYIDEAGALYIVDSFNGRILKQAK